MSNTKRTFVLGFAIFAAFFGAGNLILPPMLGLQAGESWNLVSLGFFCSAVFIPFLALIGHSRLQGTMIDFGKKVSPMFGLIFSICVYLISITLPIPRTAAVTHEMAIQPFFDSSSLLTSSIYFILVFIFAVNRGKVLDILGKYLTPVIGVILLAIIGIGIFLPNLALNQNLQEFPVIIGFLEGYQTYDAIGGLVTGGIIVVSVDALGAEMNLQEKKWMISRSGLIAMSGLLVIYVGLIFLGSKLGPQFGTDLSRPELLLSLTNHTLGNVGQLLLSVLVALACFTTAVGVIVGTADFFAGLFKHKKKAYTLTVALACLFGVMMGQFEVKYIIDMAVYVLMFIYPLSITLIILNVLPERLGSPLVFKWVVGTAFVFSIPDFLKFLIPVENLSLIYRYVPFSEHGLGWIVPSFLTFALVNLFCMMQKKSKEPI